MYGKKLKHIYNYIIKTLNNEEFHTGQEIAIKLGCDWEYDKKHLRNIRYSITYLFIDITTTKYLTLSDEYYINNNIISFVNQQNYKYFESLQDFVDYLNKEDSNVKT